VCGVAITAIPRDVPAVKRRKLAALCLLASAVGFTGCTTVPESGRSQLLLISPGEEAQSGVAAFTQIKQKEKVSTEPAVNARLTRIGQRLAAAVGRDLPNANWEFVVFDSPQPCRTVLCQNRAHRSVRRFA
jgi:predicted Zn-dependent protease